MYIKVRQIIVRSVVLGLLVLLALAFTARPGAASPRMRAPDFAAIDRYVEQERLATNMPGLALGIVEGDQIVHLKGFGVADPSGRTVTPQTPFIIGSMSKSFTALAIMQLVEAGKLELDAPVQRYLPWFRVADEQASAQITVRHLLNQTSGLPRIAGLAIEERADTSDSALETEVRAARTVALTQPPGTTYQYCDLNYTILGLIVQTVAGKTFEQYMQAHILTPLRMTDSFMSPDDAHEHGLATGHQFWFDRPVPQGQDEPLPYNRAAVPEGYISASVEDMTHYLIAQLNGGRYAGAHLLSPAGIDELHRPAVPLDGSDGSYGMGWEIVEINGVPAVSHNGSVDRFHANMILVPEGRWGIVLLMNGENYLRMNHIDGIAAGVMSLLVGRQPSPAPNETLLMIFWIALAASALQILGIARSVVLLRRWRAQPALRPYGGVRMALRVGLPLALNLLWALVGLVVVPQLLEIPLLILMRRSDVGLVMAASGAVALIWGILRAVLAFVVLRKGSTPQATAALARA